VGHVVLMWREGYVHYWLGKLYIGVDGKQEYGKSEGKSMQYSGLYSSGSEQ